MRHEIEQTLNRSRAAMAHGATAQMNARLEAAITAAGSHELQAVASAYHQALQSRQAAEKQAWEDAQKRYRAAGDAA